MHLINKKKINIENIPSVIWGIPSDKVYIYVHGKMSDKESAEKFASIAILKGYQVLSFDLPEHGERKNSDYKCNIWNGIHDLEIIGNFAKNNWKKINLFGCSLGAYFSLMTYANFPLNKCLFQSPILDMEHLIHKMFKWFDISEELLKEKKEIETPVDMMSWNYYCYVRGNPIKKWGIPTSVIYGTKDNLQDISVINEFAKKFNCSLTLACNSEHYFQGKEHLDFFYEWLKENI